MPVRFLLLLPRVSFSVKVTGTFGSESSLYAGSGLRVLTTTFVCRSPLSTRSSKKACLIVTIFAAFQLVVLKTTVLP